MFGFVSRVTSSIKSPKSCLAHALASALSTFFEVNPTTVETRLLKDARISLFDIKLKPIVLQIGKVVGSVDEIQFSWTWGGNEQTSFVSETCLTIRGARFRLVLDANETKQEETIVASSSLSSLKDDKPPATDNASSKEDDLTYLQRIVQQVVDHLTLEITDMQFIIESSTDKVVLEATNLELLSFGKIPDSTLLQRISLKSFCAYIEDDSSTRLPLLDPIGYAASVNRVSGRRFVDGLYHGLEIIGNVTKNCGIVLHADSTQLQVVSRIMELVVLAGNNDDDTVTTHAKSYLQDPTMKQNEESDTVALIPQENDEFQDARETLDEDSTANQRQPPNTTFELPLPSVSIVFPNGSKITMPDCVFSYTADGSVCNLKGSQGILINEEVSIVEFLNGANWFLDLIHHKVSVCDGDGGVMANVLWKEGEMKRLFQGIHDAVNSTPASVITDRVEAALQDNKTFESDTLQPWSIAIEGSIHLEMQGDCDNTIDASIESPSVVLANSSFVPCKANVSGITLGPTTFGNASISVPAISLASEESCYSVQGSIQAFLESIAVAENIQTFLGRVLDLDFADGTLSDKPMQLSSSFSVHVPKAILMLDEPEMKIIAEGISLRESTASCETIQWNESSGMSASVSDATATFHPYLTVKLQEVGSLHLPGILQIAEPVHNANLSLVDGTLHVTVESLRATPLLGDSQENETGLPEYEEGMTLPFPVHLGLEQLQLIAPPEETDVMIQLSSIDLTASPTGESSVVIDCRKAIPIRVISGTEWLESKVAPTKAIVLPSAQGFSVSSIKCSGIQIGPSSWTSDIFASIPSISQNDASGLVEFNGVVNVSLHSFALLDSINAMSSHVFAKMTGRSVSTSKADTALFPFPLRILEARIALAEPAVNLQAKEISMHGSVVQCRSIKCADTNESSGMSASVSDATATFHPHLALKLQEVGSLHLPGILQIATPVHNADLSLVDGTLHVAVETMRVTPLLSKTHGSEAETPGYEEDMTLPFPVHLGLEELQLLAPEEADVMIQLSSIDLIASPTGETSVSIDSRKTIPIRVISGTDWLESKMAPTKAIVIPSAQAFSVSSIKCSGIQIGPSSWKRDVSASIPLIAQNDASGLVEVNGVVNVSLPSFALLDSINAMLSSVFAKMVGRSASSSAVDTAFFPFPLRILEARIALAEPAVNLQAKEISMHDSVVQCLSIKCDNTVGVSGSVTDVSVSLLTPMQVTIATIESLHIPGKVRLVEPVAGPSLTYDDGILQTNLTSLDVVTPLVGNSCHTTTAPEANGSDEFTLPCSVNIRLHELTLRSSTDTSCFVKLQKVDALLVPTDSAVSIDMSGRTTVLVSSSSDECLRMVVDSSSALLSTSETGETMIGSLACSGVYVEPTSSFEMSASVPMLSMTNIDDELRVGGPICASVQSLEDIDRTLALFHRCFPPDASIDSTPIPRIVVTETKLSVIDKSAHFLLENVKVEGNNASCERIVANDENGMSAVISGILATLTPEITVGIDWIESMYVPGVCSIQKPVHCVTAAFMGETLCVNLGSVAAMSLSHNDDSLTAQRAERAAPTSSFTAPFPIRVNLNELVVDFPVSEVGETTHLRQIELAIKPTEPDPFSTVKFSEGATLCASIDQVENKMMKLEGICTSGTIYKGDTSAVHHFAFATKSAVVVAGFSSVDWSNMLGDGGKEKVTVLLPYASVQPFKAHLAFEGNVVATRMTVDVGLFRGHAKTTSEDLIQHLTNAILSKAPSIITNSEILGENVLEMSTKSGGRMLLASTVAGSACGSVGGLVAADSIRGAIASGKKSRNASTDDRYHFGDLSRGVARSVGQAAKSGGEVRRGSSEAYRVGDFSVGASKSVCKYTSENKSRLSAASGSGVGMAVGAAVLGPVGFIAGGYIGSKIGGSVFKEESSKSRSSENQRAATFSSESASSQGHGRNEALSPTAPTCPEEDLLGLMNEPVARSHEVRGGEDLLGFGVSNDPLTTCTPVQQPYQPPKAAEASAASIPPPRSSGRPPADSTAQPAVAGGEADLLGLGVSSDPLMACTPLQPPYEPPKASAAPNATSTPFVPRQTPSVVAVPPRNSSVHPPTGPRTRPTGRKEEGYKFGDLTKSVVARGKRRDGRSESEGYKFGDFTRGLFG